MNMPNLVSSKFRIAWAVESPEGDWGALPQEEKREAIRTMARLDGELLRFMALILASSQAFPSTGGFATVEP